MKYLGMKPAGVWQSLQTATCLMGGPLPALELLAHDVAVGAGLRIVRHVGGPACVAEGVNADPQQEADRQTEQDGGDTALLLHRVRV